MQRKSGLFVVGTLACILACPGEECVAHGGSPAIVKTHYVNKSSVAVTVLPFWWGRRADLWLYNQYLTEQNRALTEEYTDYCTGIILEPGTEKTNQVLPRGDGLYILPGRAGIQQRSVTGFGTLNELVPDPKTQSLTYKQLLYMRHFAGCGDEPNSVCVKPYKVACKKDSADGVEVDANIAVKVCLGPAKTEADSDDFSPAGGGVDGEIELLWRGDSPQCGGVDVRLTISRAGLLARLTGGSSSSSGGSDGRVMRDMESLKNCSSRCCGRYKSLMPEKGMMTDVYILIEDVK